MISNLNNLIFYLRGSCYRHSNFFFSLINDDIMHCLRNWCSVLDGSAGFTTQVFDFLKSKNDLGDQLVVSLVIDEMSIMKHVSFDGKKFVGALEDEKFVTDALVFMVVGINKHFKLPVGYFLIKTMNAEERANLVLMCLEKLRESGVKVTSVTFDSPAVHQSLFKKLGGNLDANCIRTTIDFDSERPVNMFLDNVHAIKNVRNAFAEYKVIKDAEGNRIEWRFIKELSDLQDKSTFHLGNRITSQHVNFHNQKMKARLAIQVSSRSTADAIDYCRDKLKLSQFQGSAATSRFLRVFDEAFDILNSSTKFGSWSKAPLNKNNTGYWMNAMSECEQYIKGLQDLSGRKIVETGRKIGFISFLVNFQSVRSIFFHFVENGPLEYLLTFKFCQDHLEAFFGCIRARVGCGNNPTISQFVSGYKKIIIGASARNFSKCANVNLQDDSDVIDFFTSKAKCISYIEEKFELQDEFETFCDDVEELGDLKSDAVSYIAGYVTRQIKKKTDCKVCAESLQNIGNASANFRLIEQKNRGGLIFPSDGVVKICTVAEQILQVERFSKNFFTNENLLKDLCTKTVTCMITQYPSFNNVCDHTPFHKYTITREITLVYLSIRLRHFARTKNREIKKDRIRKKLSKLVIFQHQ